jgi:hypothetical protein
VAHGCTDRGAGRVAIGSRDAGVAVEVAHAASETARLSAAAPHAAVTRGQLRSCAAGLPPPRLLARSRRCSRGPPVPMARALATPARWWSRSRTPPRRCCCGRPRVARLRAFQRRRRGRAVRGPRRALQAGSLSTAFLPIKGTVHFPRRLLILLTGATVARYAGGIAFVLN